MVLLTLLPLSLFRKFIGLLNSLFLSVIGRYTDLYLLQVGTAWGNSLAHTFKGDIESPLESPPKVSINVPAAKR